MSYSLYIRKHNSIYYAEINKDSDNSYTLTLFQDNLCSVNEVEVLTKSAHIPFFIDETLLLLKNEVKNKIDKASSFKSESVYECVGFFLDHYKISNSKKPTTEKITPEGVLDVWYLNKVQLMDKLKNLNHSDWMMVAEKSTKDAFNCQFGYIRLYNDDLLSLEIENGKITGRKIFFNEKTKESDVVKIQIADIQSILFNNIGICKTGKDQEVIEGIIKERKIEKDEIKLFNQIVQLI